MTILILIVVISIIGLGIFIFRRIRKSEYIGKEIIINGRIRRITKYNENTKIATVDSNWNLPPPSGNRED